MRQGQTSLNDLVCDEEVSKFNSPETWGKALRARDPEELQRVLLGRGASRKRTPAIDRYVVRRRAELLAEGCPDYRATLIRELEINFEVKLSGETIRQIINETNRGQPPAAAPPEPTVDLTN